MKQCSVHTKQRTWHDVQYVLKKLRKLVKWRAKEETDLKTTISGRGAVSERYVFKKDMEKSGTGPERCIWPHSGSVCLFSSVAVILPIQLKLSCIGKHTMEDYQLMIGLSKARTSVGSSWQKLEQKTVINHRRAFSVVQGAWRTT